MRGTKLSHSLKAVSVFAALALGGAAAHAGSLPITDAGGYFNMNITTYKEGQFKRVVRQQYDFSCGSAAVATLLSYHYRDPTTEQDVFVDMVEQGDPEKIRTQGFSMGDMKKYLSRRGYRSGGYTAPLDVLLKAGVPAIVLINTNGYMHFVVIKGLTEDVVLVGDPALGLGIKARSEFEKIWTGVVFVIVDHDAEGREHFNRPEEWQEWYPRSRAPVDVAMRTQQDLSSFLLTLPGTDFIVIPGGPTILETVF